MQTQSTTSITLIPIPLTSSTEEIQQHQTVQTSIGDGFSIQNAPIAATYLTEEGAVARKTIEDGVKDIVLQFRITFKKAQKLVTTCAYKLAEAAQTASSRVVNVCERLERILTFILDILMVLRANTGALRSSYLQIGDNARRHLSRWLTFFFNQWVIFIKNAH